MPNNEIWSKSLVGKIIADCQWFFDARTLQSPYLPDIPTLDWWNVEIVQKALDSIKDPNTITILMTGRRKHLFEDRIIQLCNQLSTPLDFHFYFLKETSSINGTKSYSTTLDYKFGVIQSLLDHFHGIKHIDLYDDRNGHIKKFERKLSEFKDLNRIETFNVFHVVYGKHLEQHIPIDLEKELVMDLIRICNNRITACQKRNSVNTSSRSLHRLSSVKLLPITLEVDSNPNPGLKRVLSNQIPISPTSDIQKSEEDVSDENETEKEQISRRVSISMFRNEIQLTEHVYYTGLMLNSESIELLKQKFPIPHQSWTIKATHMTVSHGTVDEVMIEKLGGIGSKRVIQATHIGSIPGVCTALKIDQSNLVSMNAVMHITLHVSPSGSAKDSNKIVDWIELDEPINLMTELQIKKVLGLKHEVIKSPVKQPISVGRLVTKHFPKLKGKQIAMAISLVNEWMSKTFIENNDENSATVEWYIQQMDLTEVMKAHQ
ncbi:hypothetical protein HDV02_001949 [Globomyces sp. JEL0801]|nr:hypothetical protein HDV02_001949 [Globomyces sp. JEL0801]